MTSQKKFYSLKAINLLLVIAMMLAGVAGNVSPVRAAVGDIVITAPAEGAKIPVEDGDLLTVQFTVDSTGKAGSGAYKILIGTDPLKEVGPYSVLFDGSEAQPFTRTITIPEMGVGNEGLQDITVKVDLTGSEFSEDTYLEAQSDAVIVDNLLPVVPVLIDPDGGETWAHGSSPNITWTAYTPHADETFSLYFSADNGAHWSKIVDIVDPSGTTSHEWTPSVVTTQGLIKIEVVDDAGNPASDQSAEVFTIYGVDNTPPTGVEVTSPVEDGFVGGVTTLNASAADGESGVAGVLFQYSLDEGVSWSDAGAGSLVSGRWQLAFNTASLPDGAVKFRAIATNGVGLSTTSAAVLAVIDNSDPIIHSFNLADGDWIGAGFTFTVTASDAQSGITQMDVFESEDDGDTWEETAVCFVGELDDPDEFGVYTLECVDVEPVVLTPATTDIKVVVTNGVGLTDEVEVTVQVDLVAPAIAGDKLMTPADSSVLHLGDLFEITWDFEDISDANAFVIDLELREDDDSLKTVIASGLANDGSFDWTVAGVPWADDYKVCLVAKDEAGNTAEDCNNPITIWGSDLTPPVVTLGVIDTPNTGEITLSAEASDTESGIQKVEFFVKSEDGDYDDALPRSVWDTAEPPLNGVYFVKAVATNGAGVTGEDESGPILIDNTLPVVGELSKAGNIYKVSASDAGSGIDSVVFEYEGDPEWVEIGAGTLNPVTGEYESPEWENVTGAAVRAVATDNVGLQSDPVSYTPDATIALSAGWNLISLPLIPDAPAIDDVLADLIAHGSVKQVIAWVHEDGALVQKAWNGVALLGIEELDPEFGYWVEMTVEDDIRFDGSVLPAPPQAPPSYVVYAGWNLIGFKSEGPMVAGFYLGEAGVGNMRAMYGWNGTRYTPITIEDNLLSENGYWLAVSTNATIYPPIPDGL